MTTRQSSEARVEESGAVAVEWIASTAAAIGLCLCLIAAPGGERTGNAPAGHRVEAPR